MDFMSTFAAGFIDTGRIGKNDPDQSVLTGKFKPLLTQQTRN
jgi:hypothetical protein